MRYVKNQYSLYGRPYPFNATITIRLFNQEVETLLRDILEVFTLPISVRVDFWCKVTSDARWVPRIIYINRKFISSLEKNSLISYHFTTKCNNNN